MEHTHTEQELANFKAYERVRQSGKWNMFSREAQLATGLDRDEYIFVMKNYESLQAQAEALTEKSNALGRVKNKNTQAKTVTRDKAYEVWQSHDGSWTWYVLKKHQIDDNKPQARWFCDVVTPYVPQGEMGDVYVQEIKSQARRIK